MSSACSAVIPTWRRPQSLAKAIAGLMTCCPKPAEILVHVDAGDDQTVLILEREFAGIARWFRSTTTQGPGGGRNLLIREAKTPLVASFDDDSWPLDPDYFAVAAELFHAHLRVAVLSGREVRPGMEPGGRDGNLRHVACYQNGACVMRREAFLGTRGHLPLRHAYGMEEADVALQLLDAGWDLLYAPALRVYHDSALEHHCTPAVNAAHIRNTALLAYLRYPVRYWPLGVLQVLNRARYAASMGRWRGMAGGFCQIPGALWHYRKERKAVCAATIALSRKLARGNACVAGVSAETACGNAAVPADQVKCP